MRVESGLVGRRALERSALLAADGETVTASCRDDRLGLWALLYVEPHRRLDDQGRALVRELLRQMLGTPHSDAGTGACAGGDAGEPRRV